MPILHPIFQASLALAALIGLAATPLLVPATRRIFSEMNRIAKAAYAAMLVLAASISLNFLGIDTIETTLTVSAIIAPAYCIGLAVITLLRDQRPADHLPWLVHASLHIGAGLAAQAVLAGCIALLRDGRPEFDSVLVFLFWFINVVVAVVSYLFYLDQKYDTATTQTAEDHSAAGAEDGEASTDDQTFIAAVSEERSPAGQPEAKPEA